MSAVTKWSGNPNDTLGSSESDHGRTKSLIGWSDSLSSMFNGLGVHFGPRKKEPESNEYSSAPQTEPQVIRIENKIMLEGRQMAEFINEYNSRTARRH